MTRKRMNLIAYMKTGPTALHSGGWRHPEAVLDDILDPSRYEDAARVMEAAKLDGLFFADGFGIPEGFGESPELFLSVGGQHSYLDPMLVLPLMARVTRHIGLGATVSTGFHSAYHLARSLATADVLSGGRVAWNVVTSSATLEARNFGMIEMPPREERYARADDVLEACKALWNSWQPDSFVMDKEQGLFVDASKVNYADYEGPWVRTRGPIATPPSPQGSPVIMQAGSSPAGRDFAAKWGEVIFTAQSGMSAMKEFREDFRARLVAAGRAENACKVLPGLTVVVGETDSIAEERMEYIDSLQAPDYDLAYSSQLLGADLRKHKSVSELAAVQGTQGIQGVQDAIDAAVKEKGMSLAEAASVRKRTNALVGSPKTIADKMEEIFEQDVCDGFVLMPTVMPVSHEQFCRAVVPELQRRGLFRTEYAATTLRGNLNNA